MKTPRGGPHLGVPQPPDLPPDLSAALPFMPCLVPGSLCPLPSPVLQKPRVHPLHRLHHDAVLPGQARSCQTRWGTLCPQSQSRKALHNWDLAGRGLVRCQLPLPWVRRFRCFKPKQVYGARTWPKWPVSGTGCLFNLPGVRQQQQHSLWPSSLTLSLSLLLSHVPPWGFPHGLRAACWQNREKGSAFACSGRRGLWTRSPSPARQTCSRLLVSLQPAPGVPAGPTHNQNPTSPKGPRSLALSFVHFQPMAASKPARPRLRTPCSSTLHTKYCGPDRRPESRAMGRFWKFEDEEAKSGRRGNRTKGLADPAKDREGTLAMKR